MIPFQLGFLALQWQDLGMIAIGLTLLYLGIARKMEPLLLIPIGSGILLANLPLGDLFARTPEGKPAGLFSYIFASGIETELIPTLIFLGLGAMTDFVPLIANPKTLLLGAAAQLGVYVAFFVALLIGFDLKEAASIGIIGGADGPTTVFLTTNLAPHILGLTAISVYSYMALVPIIQPPIIRLLTTEKERAIYMEPQLRPVSRREVVLFPLIAAIFIILIVPKSAPLIGALMLGNLLRVSGVTDRLANTAEGAFMDILVIFLGTSIGASMNGASFFQPRVLGVFFLGLFAFAVSTAGGVLLGKLMNRFSKDPINPMIGAAGVSAVPMAARVVQDMARKANPRNFLLMHAMGPNVAGVIGTVVAAGVFLGMLGS